MIDNLEGIEDVSQEIKPPKPIRENSLFSLTSEEKSDSLQFKEAPYPRLTLKEFKKAENGPEVGFVAVSEGELLFRNQENIGSKQELYKLTMRLEEPHFKPGVEPYGSTRFKGPWGQEYRLFRIIKEEEQEIDYEDAKKRTKLVKTAYSICAQMMNSLNPQNEKGKGVLQILAKFQNKLKIYLT